LHALWISDILTAIPPAALRVARRCELREPNERFPYGYFRLCVAIMLGKLKQPVGGRRSHG